MPFDEWLNDPGNMVDKTGFIKRHLIPADPRLHRIESFEEFLAERAKLIAQKLQAEFQR